jgi:hypothetical protein
MNDVKISELPAGTADPNAIVPATNAAGTATEKVTLGGIASLVTDAGQLATGSLDDARLSANVVLTADARLTDTRDPNPHNHAIADVTGLQGAIDGAVTNAGNVSAIQRLTQAEYDAIATPDANTLYVIVG